MWDGFSLTQSTDVGVDPASFSNVLNKDWLEERGDHNLMQPSLEAERSCCLEAL